MTVFSSFESAVVGTGVIGVQVDALCRPGVDARVEVSMS
jgi:hypothetical protein